MTERKTHLDTLAISLLVACCAFWGLQQILIKTTVAEVPPLWQATIRMTGASVLLWLWCVWRKVPLFGKDGTAASGLVAGLLFAGEFVCIYLGLQNTTASRLTVFLYTSPFWVALLLPRWVPSERLRGLQWLGLILAFVAVVVAFSESFGHTSHHQLVGDALGLAAGMLWGLTTLTIRTTKLATASPEKTLFFQVALTALVCPVLSVALGEPWRLDYTAGTWASIAAQAVIGAFASYLTWMWLLRHYPATQMSSFTFLTPLFALTFGVALLHEPLTVQLVLALCAVAVGIVLVNRRAPVVAAGAAASATSSADASR